jgi:nicotinamidase-related amidase
MNLNEILSRSALLLVDFQNDFIEPVAEIPRVGVSTLDEQERIAVVQNATRLVECTRDAKRLIFHVRTAFRPDLADCLFSPFGNATNSQTRFLVEGSQGASFIDKIEVQPSDFIVTKKTYSAFQHTPLDRLLAKAGVETCIVAGCGGVTGGIDDTTRQGAALGYQMVLASDAVFPLASYDWLTLKNRAFLQSTKEIVQALSQAPPPGAARQNGTRPTLIVVDMQNDSIHPDGCNERLGFSHLTAGERALILANNQRLIHVMRHEGWPVIFVNLAHRMDLTDSASPHIVHRNKALPVGTGRRTEGTWGAQTVGELAPRENDYVLIKKGQSAFAFTPLHRLLRNLAVSRCLITGGAVTGCISDTVREGAGLGYPMIVVSDATYPPYSPHLPLLEGRAEIKTTDEVLGILKRQN